ncbi:hypothetical protein ABZ897_43440 [Nonomuraea sp. NPDC046802]|uniref:hypothetical protein n=1 Tax=Nonomuraea sp. NPDC046802 TaxID=3154919 RepID=UPI0033F759AB
MTSSSGLEQQTAPLVASVDVEWTKNYRIQGGNRPFCYSITWLALAAHGGPVFQYVSAYVESEAETQDLIDAADRLLAELLDTPTLITGHQLSSDLAILANASGQPTPGVEAMRRRWHGRRAADPAPLVDTRYDTDHLLSGTSRRLVDVATELGLDVTQPELRNTSMTALHRRWLHEHDPAARERITVLNLRHSLSTALIAAAAAGQSVPLAGLNVNRLLFDHLADIFDWVRTPVFTRLLRPPSIDGGRQRT